MLRAIADEIALPRRQRLTAEQALMIVATALRRIAEVLQ